MAKRRRRRMTAKQRKFFGKRRKSAAKVVVVSSNPRRHRRRSRKSVFSVNPRPRRRFRRNPITRGSGLVGNSLIPGAIGAAGAIGTDWLLGNFGRIVPMQFRTPTMMPFVRIAAALGVGAIVGAMGNEEAAAEAAAGGIVVALYGLGLTMFAGRLPGLAGMRRPMGVGRYLKGVSNGALMQRRRLARLGYQRMRRLRGLTAQNARTGYVGPARTLGRYLQQH